MLWAGMRLSTQEVLKRGNLPPSMSSNDIIIFLCLSVVSLLSIGITIMNHFLSCTGMTRCWLYPVWTLTLLYHNQQSWCYRDECPQAHNSSRSNTIICNFCYDDYFLSTWNFLGKTQISTATFEWNWTWKKINSCTKSKQWTSHNVHVWHCV